MAEVCLSKTGIRRLEKGDSMGSVLGIGKVYHGWLLVFTLAVTETTSRGILYSAFTVFLMPVEAEFGWSLRLDGCFLHRVAALGHRWHSRRTLAGPARTTSDDL